MAYYPKKAKLIIIPFQPKALCCDCHADKTRKESKQIHPSRDIKYYFPNA